MIETMSDTLPLAILRENPSEILDQIRSTQRPVALTVDGQAVFVIQEASAYQRLLDIAADADADEDLRQSLADIAEGRTRPAREAFAELREEYGIRG